MLSDQLIRITPGVHEAIASYSRQSYPQECCGVLIGKQSIESILNIGTTRGKETPPACGGGRQECLPHRQSVPHRQSGQNYPGSWLINEAVNLPNVRATGHATTTQPFSTELSKAFPLSGERKQYEIDPLAYAALERNLCGRMDLLSPLIEMGVAVSPLRPGDSPTPIPLATIDSIGDKRSGLKGEAPVIIGFFHSHPDSLPAPSPLDLEMAQGLYEFAKIDYIYAIQTAHKNSVGPLTFWSLSTDQHTFIELSVEKWPTEG